MDGKTESSNLNKERLDDSNPKLRSQLIDMIESAGGAISFLDFMEVCLYSPEGYYNSSGRKTGKEGDFYTSPNVSPVFGEVIADYIYESWQAARRKIKGEEAKEAMSGASEAALRLNIIEYGAGRGQLAQNILDRMNELRAAELEAAELEPAELEPTELELAQDNIDSKANDFHYYIIEKSQVFGQEQRKALAGYPVTWLDSINDFPESKQEKTDKSADNKGKDSSPSMNIVLANELLDAFAVHLVQQAERLEEVWVAYDAETDSFRESYRAAGPELIDYFASQNISLLEGQRAEVNLAAQDWLQEVTLGLEGSQSSQLIIIDYGYEAEEIYGPHHKDGTLMTYYQHQAQDNPYINLGRQDITSHVNFSILASWARDMGYEVEELQTQAQFLVEQGIYNKIQPHNASDPFSPVFKKNLAIKQLLLPQTMGQQFKFFLARKN